MSDSGGMICETLREWSVMCDLQGEGTDLMG